MMIVKVAEPSVKLHKWDRKVSKKFIKVGRISYGSREVGMSRNNRGICPICS